MKEWTLMFYFASDNTLAPVTVPLLKDIKYAGFQENIDVLVYFDPNELGVPTRIFDVNRERKRDPNLPNAMIGDGADPFVRNMVEDDVKPEKIDTSAGPASTAMRAALENPDTVNAETALENFLGFCRENYQAKRYMLFLVGHGMVVGNDAFLPDENPVSAITLGKLGKILNTFTDQVKAEKGNFELLALHSCSMSAIEVAYELKGTAKYMIASEGPAFVGSWPYRQLLKKIFNNLEEAKENARRKAKGRRRDQDEAENNPHINILALLKDLYFLTLYNATDFLLAGYSHDLALCSLDPKIFNDVTPSIQKLVGKLNEGLKASSDKDGSVAAERGKRIKELVLLAHWEAQSYWEENYTDLFDFCRCLRERCDTNNLADLRTACSNVIEKLGRLVIHSENFGSKSQYSHGLSIYFPWSRPIETATKGSMKAKTGLGERYEDDEKGILERYKDYAFTKELGDNSWLTFLQSYFDETKRRSRIEEDGKAVKTREKAFVAACGSFHPFGALASLLPGKPSPILGTTSPFVGAACTCPSIKNYPEETQPKETRGKTVTNVQAFAITKGALKAFK